MAAIIALSIVGYGGLLVFDLPAARARPFVRAALTFATSLLLAASFILGIQTGADLVASVWTRALGLLLGAFGGLLAAYSALFEIPLRLARRARQRSGVTAGQPASERTLMCEGTYALCRHPGFLWMLFYLTGLVLFVSRTGALELALTWAVCDFIVVYVQDRAIFPRAFEAYARYQRTTPFVIPSPDSLRAAIHSFMERPDEPLSTENE